MTCPHCHDTGTLGTDPVDGLPCFCEDCIAGVDCALAFYQCREAGFQHDIESLRSRRRRIHDPADRADLQVLIDVRNQVIAEIDVEIQRLNRIWADIKARRGLPAEAAPAAR